MSAGGFWKPAPVQAFADASRDDDYIPTAAFTRSNAPIAQQQRLLPIYKHKAEIVNAVEDNSVVVVVGETGSGKSTQIPQYLVEYGWTGNDFTIVCTQPRRIAATTLAKRVAEEMGTQLGNKVGYSVRFDDVTSPQTQIKYVTEGMLLREATIHDPLLSQYSVVVCDEVQERNLDSDMLLGALKKIRKIRKELRVIVCSATADAQKFLDFFVDSDESKDKKDQSVRDVSTRGTILSVDGRQYPVDTYYLEQPASNYLTSMIDTCWYIHIEQQPGDILCFLPSGEDIDTALHLCEEKFQPELAKVELLPFYGSLPFKMQALVFQGAAVMKDGRTKRRIIFATNIAETSVTIPNISYVIDAGLVKMPYFDPQTALERLFVTPISHSSARQRAGRAGRIQSGKCYRLYTEKYMMENMQKYNIPEILRSDLTHFVLTLKALGVDNLLEFDLIDFPSQDSLVHALDCLYALDAIDSQSNLTKDGLDMSIFPTDTKIAKMLLNSLENGCSWEILAVASCMQVRDLFIKPNRPTQMQKYELATSKYADVSGDHVSFVNLLADADATDYEYCRENYINYNALKRALEVRNQLGRFLRRFGKVDSLGPAVIEAGRSKAIRRCVTSGFFFNIAKLGNDGRYRTLKKQIPVAVCSTSLYGIHSRVSSEYIVYGETMDGSRGGIELHTVSAIEAKWLHELAPHYWE